jgi:hypothetical protein
MGSAGSDGRTDTDPNGAAAQQDFFDMSIEQLMDVEIVSSAALTPTSVRMAPAAVTMIAREEILASGANAYLNLGLQYAHSPHLTVRLDGYDLLGVFDEDLNKRNCCHGFGDYRSHAPAAGPVADLQILSGARGIDLFQPYACQP